MSNTNGAISYQSIYVNSGITANVISATTISANTFYGGSLSASFIGNGDVNDQEFKYISGITSDTQTQLNTKRFFNEPFIVSGTPSGLLTAKTLVGDGIVLNENGTTIEMDAHIKNLVLNTITVTSGITQQELNFNPTGWNTSLSQSSSIINITQNNIISIISGLNGGTPGRICIIRNSSKTSLFVFEHDSYKTNAQNRFLFSDGESYFLMPGQNITLIYNGLGVWTNLYTILKKNKYRNYNDFTNKKTQRFGTVVYAPPNNRYSTLGLSNFGGFNMLNTVTSFLDSDDCLVLNWNGPYNVNSVSRTIRPYRGDYPSSTNATLTIGKISLNTDIGWPTNGQFVFGNGVSNTASRLGDANSTVAFTPFGWSTPTATAVDTTVWYRLLSSTYTATSLKLSSTTNNWVYLVNYTTSTFIGILYSFDFKTFTVESSLTSIVSPLIYNIWFKPSVTQYSNSVYIDELIYTTNVNY